MILESGDMWSILEVTNLFLITSNSTIKKNGALVMGRGLAREARDRVPGLDLEAGRAVTRSAIAGRSDYGLVILPTCPFGLFQVKRAFKQPALLPLIERATFDLLKLLERARDGYARSPWSPHEPFHLLRVDLNFPGIGNGGLGRDDVLPIIASLPDIVHVWEKE